jgi:hypothetical protein
MIPRDVSATKRRSRLIAPPVRSLSCGPAD